MFGVNTVFYDGFSLDNLSKWVIVGDNNSWTVGIGRLKDELFADGKEKMVAKN